MVWNITKTEFIKLKRCNIIWAGIALMFLSVLLTLFTSIAMMDQYGTLVT